MDHLQRANAAGRASPLKEEGRCKAHTAALEYPNTQQTDSRQTGDGLQPDRAKQLATLTARCALAGITLTEATNDQGSPVFRVSQWAQCRQFDSLQEVAAWLSHVRGTRS